MQTSVSKYGNCRGGHFAHSSKCDRDDTDTKNDSDINDPERMQIDQVTESQAGKITGSGVPSQ
jgi:hypothetical protein